MNTTQRILEKKFSDISDFEFTQIKRVRLWIQKNTTQQILKLKFHYVSNLNWKLYVWSDFDLLNVQRVRFGIKNSTTRRFCILFLNGVRFHIEKKYKASGFDIDTFRLRAFQRQLLLKITFCFFNPRKRQFLQFSCTFRTKVPELKFHYTSDFELKGKQRVRFWNKKNNASGFDSIFSQGARLCI